jgi:hypothetical protein
MTGALTPLLTAEGWGRALAGFRRHYGLDLRQSLHSMRYEDVAVLLDEMPGDWGDHEENVAMLVDRLDFLLNAEYASWTTDTDDPELQRERARMKREGIEPPPFPLLRPVARRPAALHQALLDDYERRRQHYDSPPEPAKAGLAEILGLFGPDVTRLRG